MRRFPLRLKIAGFAGVLVVLATSLVAVFSVIVPWRDKRAAQERLAVALAKTAVPLGVDLRADGAHFDANRVRRLVEDSKNIKDLEIVYALVWDEKGHLDPVASTVNTESLRSISPQLAQLYLRDPGKALELLALGRSQAGIQRQAIRLATEDKHRSIGHLDLGLSTAKIDAELRKSLQRDGLVLAGSLLFGVLAAFWMARRIAQPLTDLSAAMGRVSEGDFEVRVNVARQTNDEVTDLARSFDQMAQGLRERERLRDTLGRYVSDPVAERILEEQDDLMLRGEVRQITVLFLDVRGFTGISERLSPTEVVALLNEYFDVVVDRVTAHGGSVNKFIGDAAMCIWGAPRRAENAERAAVKCAIEIQQSLATLSADRMRRGLSTVGFGIGINAGEAVAGNLGAARRLEYTVIGDAVNLAQRLESQARAGEVLISQSVYEKVAADVVVASREPVRLKGKSQPVPLWEVKELKAQAASKTEAA